MTNSQKFMYAKVLNKVHSRKFMFAKCKNFANVRVGKVDERNGVNC